MLDEGTIDEIRQANQAWESPQVSAVAFRIAD